MKLSKPNLQVQTLNEGSNTEVICVSEKEGLYIFQLVFTSKTPKEPSPIKISWGLPSLNVKGVWKPSIFRENRLQYDWELEHLKSRISVNAPIICVYGHNDENIATCAVSDAINPISMNALLREEDNCIYFHFHFFSEKHPATSHYKTEIRIDTRSIKFSYALAAISKWWETFESLKPMRVPSVAKKPFYCTWYQFHQELQIDTLLEECKLAKELGFESIIIDDGWQTLDTNRGYDYTGDWKPERIPEMKSFVNQIHDIGLKVILWYSVPFCGKKSTAYKRFKGKFLTEDHRWAPVFDPRYPEVREFLINIYANTVSDWNLDGLKLDFIDEFKVYNCTELTLEKGRDYASVDAGTERLMTDIIAKLLMINQNIVIEFRQQYIGPAMRKFGNMFRSFDCPTDSNTNRVRTTDIKMLCANSAVHSDPLTWNKNEIVEIAAFQVLNSIFAVPQISVHLGDLPEDHYCMLKFYMAFWKEHSDILLHGNFIPKKPLLGYPLLSATKNGKLIVGIYDDIVFDVENSFETLYILNATFNKSVVIRNKENYSTCKVQCWDCRGEIFYDKKIMMTIGLIQIDTPVSGLIKIVKKI